MKCVVFWAVISMICVSSSLSAAADEDGRFDRVFCWGKAVNEETAAALREAGVTDIPVYDRKQYELAVKYGMTPYYGVFLPCGPHIQGLTDAEQRYHGFITASDIPGTARERYPAAARRRISVNYQYGGEPVSDGVEVLAVNIACFRSDEGLRLTRKRLEELLSPGWPGVKGVFLDFIGYMNYRSCECEKCRRDYQEYLQKNGIVHSQKVKDVFFRDAMVDYYDRVTALIKEKRPDLKVVIHCYPAFIPEPLYGNRTKADICGQTVAWYFPWSAEKIADYTRRVLAEQHKYHSGVTGVPFIGIKAAKGGSLYSKPPEVVERELQIILKNGGRMLMVCNGNDMIKPGYFEVFRKYCGSSPKVGI